MDATIVINEEVYLLINGHCLLVKENGIDARVFFWPLSMLPMFEEEPQNKVSYGLYKQAINLPSYHDIRNRVKKIAEVIRSVLCSGVGRV